METLTEEEFKKRYGQSTLDSFEKSKKEEGLFSSIKRQIGEAALGGVEKTIGGVQDFANSFPTKQRPEGSPLEAAKGVTKVVSGPIETLFSPLAPVFNATIGKGIEFVGKKISDIPGVQKFATSKAGEVTSDVAEIVGNTAEFAGGVAGLKVPGKIAPAAEATASKIGSAAEGVRTKVGESTKYVRSAVRDVVPTRVQRIDENIREALELTPTDLVRIEQSTGNPVGRWMADNNLIGLNKKNTQAMIKSNFDTNYQNVRNVINKIDTEYGMAQIPGYADALNAIYAKVSGVPGLEKVAAQVENYIKLGRPIKLKDVQTVKELLDDHFSLYKVTGEISDAVAKQGLANIRTKLKEFIEDQVKKTTGEDIRAMNNSVSTAKALLDAIEKRSTRGLTRMHITWRDFAVGAGLTYFTTPLIGLAVVLAKKVMESPTARLRFARHLDRLTDAERAKISQQLKDGEVPQAVKDVVGLEKTNP